MRKKISAEVRLIHAEQMSLYNFVILRKKQWTQMKTKQLKQDILTLYCIMFGHFLTLCNKGYQKESIGFPKLCIIKPFFLHDQKDKTKM